MAEANLQYPLGPMDMDAARALREQRLASLAALPADFAAAYAGLNDTALDTPYREGGWTLRQLAHHVADSHMQAFVRLKHALTEDWPTVKPYDEKAWAQTGEIAGPVDAPLTLLAGLHPRWVVLFRSLSPAQWERGVQHPELGRLSAGVLLAMYDWHGRHHTAHVVGLRQRMGW